MTTSKTLTKYVQVTYTEQKDLTRDGLSVSCGLAWFSKIIGKSPLSGYQFFAHFTFNVSHTIVRDSGCTCFINSWHVYLRHYLCYINRKLDACVCKSNTGVVFLNFIRNTNIHFFCDCVFRWKRRSTSAAANSRDYYLNKRFLSSSSFIFFFYSAEKLVWVSDRSTPTVEV